MHPPLRYLERHYRLPGEREEEVVAALWEQGTLGVQSEEPVVGQLRMVAWFTAAPAPHPAIPASSRQPRRGVVLEGERWVTEEDWMAAYRRQSAPLKVGECLLIDPGEPSPRVADGDRILLRIPARTAFGTGSHASTRLILEWLEELPLGGWSVLDVGAGSGVLSLAAERLGARFAAGVEIDLQAALLAGQNARLNGLAPRCVAGGLEAIVQDAGFDLVLVNIVSADALPLVSRIARRVRVEGTVLASGLLVEECEEAETAWRRVGLEPVEHREDEEWTALRLEKR